MSSIELFRFRTVRHIQNKTTGFSALAPTLSAAKPRKSAPAPITPDGTINIDIGTTLGTFGWLEQVSQQCAAASDDLTPAELTSLLPPDWLTQVATASWPALQQQLADLLAALATLVRDTAADPTGYGIPVIPVPIAQNIELVARIILVQDCITTLAADRALEPSQRRLQKADDIRVALTFRSVALPAELFSKTPPVLARAPGVTDLSVVKDEWNRYIPDQIANVINVLPGESFESGSRHLEKSVQSQSTTSVQSTTITTENSQTQSSTLSATSTSDASLNIGVHAQVETSGQYGPTNVQTNIGGQLQFSQSQSKSTTRTAAQEIVARSVKTVSETVTQAQTSRTTVKDTSHQQHKLQNTGQNVTVGIYRWLSVVHRVQLINYPNRFVVEFEIPEPGAWLRWALNNQPDMPWDNPDPGPFAVNRNDPRLSPSDPTNLDVGAPPLQPTDITPLTATGLAARWMVQGLTPPPPKSLTLGNSFSIAQQTTTLVLNDNSLAVPNGYVAKTWTVDIASAGGDDNSHPSCLRVSVGGNGVTFTVAGTHTTYFVTGTQGTVQTQPLGQATSFQPGNITAGIPVGDINTGIIPVYVHGWFLASGAAITLNVTIHCEQDAAYLDPNSNGLPYVIWQQKTFDQISAAYSALLSAHNQERDSRAQTKTGPLVVGPPQLNLARAVAELKRLAIQNLLGQTFTGFSLLSIDKPSGEPSLDPKGTVASSPVIQFFEQAFEWENIVYICYPYFWGDKTRWIINATGASADPIFDQFLNAGSARLVVPARPGFEQVVNFYLYTSCIWSGKNPPSPNDPGYLSVADEIQALQVGATDGTPVGDPWEITLPTTLLWAGTDPATLPKNANASIGSPPAQPSTGAALSANASVAGSPSPAVFGQPTTFTASISAAAGGAIPTGQVTFLVDGQLTADSPVALDANGKATSAPIATLKVGSHSVIVTYPGDGNFSAATGTFQQVVNQASSSVALTSSANPTPRTQAINLSAAVTAVAPGAGTPTGQVSFLVDGTPTADSPLNLDATGKASSAAVTLRRGSRTVRAEYSGDGTFAASADSLTQRVT